MEAGYSFSKGKQHFVSKKAASRTIQKLKPFLSSMTGYWKKFTPPGQLEKGTKATAIAAKHNQVFNDEMQKRKRRKCNEKKICKEKVHMQ